MKIIPYIYYRDHWSISYEHMQNIWQKMADEGSVETVFCTGLVTTFEQFYAFIQRPDNVVSVVFDPDNDPVLLFWLNSFNKCSAYMHFCCFKKVWGKGSAIVCHMAKKHIFDRVENLETLVGILPTDNYRAKKMADMMGAKSIGFIPNYSINFYTNEKISVEVLYIER